MFDEQRSKQAKHGRHDHDAMPGAKVGKHTLVETEGHAHHEHHEAHGASAAPAGIDASTLQKFIAKHEGDVDHVYLDSRGFKTGGIGHLLEGTSFAVGQHLSTEQITAWFQQDVAIAIAGAKQVLGATFDKLDAARQIVVIDMVFNMGAGSSGFAGFHTLIGYMREGNFAAAANDMLHTLWASQVGTRAVEDAAVMRSGQLAGASAPPQHEPGKPGHEPAHQPTDPPRHEPHPPEPAHGTASSALVAVRDGKKLLQLGSRGAAVVEVQQLLHLPHDGTYGPQTEGAVERFQRSHGLAVDGVVGEQTIAKLAPIGSTGPSTSASNGSSTAKGAPNGWTTIPGDQGQPSHKPAPPLDEVRHGKAVLEVGEHGAAVAEVQKLLGAGSGATFGPVTRSHVIAFQKRHHAHRDDGIVDANTLELLEKHPASALAAETHDGLEQRSRLLSIARSASIGRRPDGLCYKHVCEFLVACHGYGKIIDPYTQFPSGDLPVAHDFADLMNTASERYGLIKLSVTSPYDAPSGSIVVVAAGSPGTANPTAGDISVADGKGNFYNGGAMSYGGRAGWAASPRAELLGCYVPR